MASGEIPKRENVAKEHAWDLAPLFESDRKWELLYQEVEKELAGCGRFKGRLDESAELLAEAVDFQLEMYRKIDRLYTYAHLKSDQDKSDSFNLGLQDKAVGLYTRAGEMFSFMTPEIQAIADDVMEAYLRQPPLLPFRFHLEQVLRFKPHTLDEKTERILAMSSEIARAPSQIFGQLDNVDLRFGKIADEKGEETELSHGNFIRFLMNPDREVRRTAFRQYYETYDRHKHTIAASLSHSIKKDVFYAKVRGHESCLKAALFGDNVPEEVYGNLLDSVKSNLSPLFEYLDFRKKALGLDTLRFYDTYVPLVSEIDFLMDYEEAAETACEALAPLGEKYVETLREGLFGGWVDRYENKGKRSGAYASGCYDSPPYMLLNHEKRSIGSLYTLAHEAGHAMHTWHSNRRQPYAYHDYTIFVAEVASTFNEVLLSRHLLKKYEDDPRMTAYVLNREIDNIRGTLFRQTMFAEFERITHRMAEEHTPLTVDSLAGEYEKLLGIYFGDSLALDPELRLECLRIPHFYSAFYVYKYATGISAAIALAKKVLEEGSRTRDAYLGFLGLGGSKYPLDELMEAGVDLRSSEPVESAVAYFESLTRRFFKIYKMIGRT